MNLPKNKEPTCCLKMFISSFNCLPIFALNASVIEVFVKLSMTLAVFGVIYEVSLDTLII